jgi:hypothetical protein
MGMRIDEFRSHPTRQIFDAWFSGKASGVVGFPFPGGFSVGAMHPKLLNFDPYSDREKRVLPSYEFCAL